MNITSDSLQIPDDPAKAIKEIYNANESLRD